MRASKTSFVDCCRDVSSISNVAEHRSTDTDTHDIALNKENNEVDVSFA